EVDITDLPIAKIADQFLAVISELGLNQAADYLEMAARLLRIKAQMLLPRRLGDDEWEDPRAELVRRLLEYQQIRELVEWLGAAAAPRGGRDRADSGAAHGAFGVRVGRHCGGASHARGRPVRLHRPARARQARLAARSPGGAVRPDSDPP